MEELLDIQMGEIGAFDLLLVLIDPSDSGEPSPDAERTFDVFRLPPKLAKRRYRDNRVFRLQYEGRLNAHNLL